MKHKTAIATAASAAGVLVASVAALGANVGILQNTDDSFGQLSASTTVEVLETSSTPAPEERFYRIPGIADISVATDGADVWVTSVQPSEGWSQRTSSDDSGAEVELLSATERLEFHAYFRNGDVRTTLEREILDGDDDGDGSVGSSSSTSGSRSSGDESISPTTLAPTSSSSSSPATTQHSTTLDDDRYDDHSDDHEDDDHEEEEYEHEHEGWDDDD